VLKTEVNDTGNQGKNSRLPAMTATLSRGLQVSLVYVNTLMIQQVLAEPAWQGRLTLRDLQALSPLKWQHINPYGTFILNMQERLPLEQVA
jgi:hypothetical protein